SVWLVLCHVRHSRLTWGRAVPRRFGTSAASPPGGRDALDSRTRAEERRLLRQVLRQVLLRQALLRQGAVAAGRARGGEARCPRQEARLRYAAAPAPAASPCPRRRAASMARRSREPPSLCLKGLAGSSV